MPKAGACQHLVQFYESEADLARTLDEFAGAGLEAGEGVVLIATEAHLDSLERTLAARGLDLDRLRAADRYIPLDAEKLFELFMVQGRFESAGFFEIVGNALHRCVRASPAVRVFGEVVALLWARKHYVVALQLEQAWQEQSKARNISVLCSYPWSGFADEDLARTIPDICAAHTHAVFQ
jgi:hypothetical protein